MTVNSDKNLSQNNAATCPYCGQLMQQGYFLIGGGVTFAESTVAFGPVFSNQTDIERMLNSETPNRPQIIVSDKGYRHEPKQWPKPGMFCQDCLAFVVKVRNG